MADPNPEWAIYIPLVSSLVGAGVGAWTAQYIAARNKRLDERMKEVRAGNAATTIAYGITDHFISMKEQIVKPIGDDFAIMREKFIRADAAPKPPGVSVIVFAVPLDTFRFNASLHEELQDIVLKELSAPVRPSMMVAILSRTLVTLNKLADDRNSLVEGFKAAQRAGKEISPYAYYGVQFPSGGADTQYADSLRHISEYTDDVIEFSIRVGNDLRAYALALRRTLPTAMQLVAPRITTMSFKKEELRPKPDKYKSYDDLTMQIRVLGAGVWTAAFEALALAQYQVEQEHWVS